MTLVPLGVGWLCQRNRDGRSKSQGNKEYCMFGWMSIEQSKTIKIRGGEADDTDVWMMRS